LKAIADSYGVKPENLPEVIQNLSDTVRNPDADPTLRQSALASLTEMMGAVHNEAYVDGNKGLKDAINKSPIVAAVDTQGKDQHGSVEDGFISQVGEQAKIYLNQIAGNAFGDFAYINDNGEVVFRSCFVAGTLVWTKDGQRPIETIKVGDIVLSWDEESHQNEYRLVTETFVNPTTTIIKITYTDGTILETTWNHPFYLQQGLWVKAKDLMTGDLSVTAEGKVATVASVVESIQNETVYNFEVEENHTYFVSKAGVLVHNYDIEKGLVQGGDTISSIRKELNEKYGTSYTDEDIARMNGLISKDKIYPGTMIVSPELFESLPVELKRQYFNNKQKGSIITDATRTITLAGGYSGIFHEVNGEVGSLAAIKERGSFAQNITYYGVAGGADFATKFIPKPELAAKFTYIWGNESVLKDSSSASTTLGPATIGVNYNENKELVGINGAWDIKILKDSKEASKSEHDDDVVPPRFNKGITSYNDLRQGIKVGETYFNNEPGKWEKLFYQWLAGDKKNVGKE
ncbi:polymorphic toxin-type HINT domain-containing protein, partial [Leptospira koniambonensis]|uniref:polymorphic toxin-type HINT domain-containing protein n=1 Tax=Leptospira koniambonensis TaxID=2484950 RepID=UPI003EBFA97F